MTGTALVVLAANIWLWIGGAVAVPFLLFGIDRLDEDARGAYVFRPLLIPGILLIWPLVLWRWYVLANHKDDWAKRHRPARHNHKWVALALPVSIIAILVVGQSVRQDWPSEFVPRKFASSKGVDQ